MFYLLVFLFGRCVKAEAAAVLAALLDFGLRSTRPAADAAFLLVTSLFLRLYIIISLSVPVLSDC
jgi:hypothetical protein